jgi:hypothetical protein
MYDALYEKSKQLMKRNRVELTPEQRELACMLMAEALHHHKVELIDICVSKKHWHCLARFCGLDQENNWKRSPRHLMGIAKKHSARVMSDEGHVERGGVWAVRCKVLPIRNRKHQLNVAKYIPDHAKKGAAVYSILKARLERDAQI